MSAARSSQLERPGSADFDFLRGRWTVHSRRLQSPLDPDASDWREFTMQAENRPILGGLGNVDEYRSSEFPDQPDFAALALRLFDPDAAVWRIWWVSVSSGGQLDTPVIGGFVDGHGVFECDDVLGGQAVKVRYEWLLGGDEPLWKQSFSFDSGATWQENWIMTWVRR